MNNSTNEAADRLHLEDMIAEEETTSHLPELTDEQAVALMPDVLAFIKAQRAQEEARKAATSDELDLMDRTKDAEELLCVYANNSGTRKLPGVAKALYDAAGHLIQSDDAMHQRVGYIMALDAFLAAPEAVQQAVRNLRQALVDSDPGLALMGNAPMPAEMVTPRYHQINGSTFFIDRDANLTIDEREGGRELVKLTGKEAYGLLAFMRLRGVADLIERVDAAEQDKDWRDYEADPETIASVTRKQAYEFLVEDKELLALLVQHIGKDYVITPREAA